MGTPYIALSWTLSQKSSRCCHDDNNWQSVLRGHRTFVFVFAHIYFIALVGLLHKAVVDAAMMITILAKCTLCVQLSRHVTCNLSNPFIDANINVCRPITTTIVYNSCIYRPPRPKCEKRNMYFCTLRCVQCGRTMLCSMRS